MGRSILLIAALVVFCVSGAWAQVADLGFGQIEVGGMWQPSEIRPRIAPWGSPHVKLNTFAGTAEVGVFPQRLSIFGGIGNGDVHAPTMGIKEDVDLFWRAGVRGTFWQGGPWSIGLSADAQQWRIGSTWPSRPGVPYRTDLHITEYRVRPTVAWQGNTLQIYGGPSITWLDGDSVALYDRFVAYSRVETRAELGAFMGARWRIHPHVTLTAEGEASGVCASAMLAAAYRF